jgi:hypothetical protein
VFILITAGLIVLFWFVAGGVALRTPLRRARRARTR